MFKLYDQDITMFPVAQRVAQAPEWVSHLTIARAIGAFCLYEVGYYMAYRYGMSFSHVTASPFWFPDSILLCALLLTPTRWWWTFLVGALPIRMAVPEASGIPHWFLLDTFIIDSFKCIVTTLALRRFIPDPLHLRTIRDFSMYCLIAVVLVPAMAAFAGAEARVLLGDDYWMSWKQWFMGNVLAHLVVTPAILYGLPGAARALAGLSPSRWLEGLLVATGLIGTGHIAFMTSFDTGGFAEPLFYAPVPFLFWAALRFGMFGASAAIVAISVTAVEQALQGHGPFAGRSPGETALALQQFLLLRAAPLYLVALLIEQKKVAEDGLVESERRYREVVESQMDLVCRFLPDGKLTFVNEAFCRAFRRDREALVGSDFVTLLSAAAHDAARTQIDRAILPGMRGEWECQVPRPDGTVGWRHWRCHRVIRPRGEVEEYQAIGHDITDRKLAEEANRRLTHASRLAVVGEFTALVAHEINQPLGAILSNADAAEMLLDSADPPLAEIRQILADIRKSDLRANDAIVRIRALLRKQEICLKPLDLNEVVSDVLRLTAADVLRRQIEVRPQLARGLPRVCGDMVHLQQVLLNVIANAMDAMKDTPVANRLLAVHTRYVGLDSVEVVVADRGHGIPPDKLTGIFESFSTTKSDGMGLGLSIARTIVETHSGRIWAENRAGGGAAFHFTVKVAKGEGG